MDESLVAGLKRAKGRACFFALLSKGSADGRLIVGLKKIPAKDIAEAKKDTGASACVTGRCLFEDGMYVFETAKEAPSTLAALVKRLVHRDAGMSIRAEFRVGEEEEAESEVEETQAADVNKVTFLKRWLDLRTAANAFADANPAVSAKVKTAIGAITAHTDKGRYVEAQKLLESLEKVVKR